MPSIIIILLISSRLVVFVLAGCTAPNPAPYPTYKTITTTVVDNDVYVARSFDLKDWTPKKNFGFTGSAGTFLVAGGENGSVASASSTIYKYDPIRSIFDANSVPEQLSTVGRSYLTAVGSVFVSGDIVFAVFGGINFTPVTKEKGVRSSLLSVFSSSGEGTLINNQEDNGLSPRGGSCVAGITGGDFFIYGGENMGTAVDGGIILLSSKIVRSLPVDEAPPARFAHSCVYNQADGLVYVFGGSEDSSTATSVYTFSRQNWRWNKIGNLSPSKAGLYYYGFINSKIIVIGENLGSRSLGASIMTSTHILPAVITLADGAFRATSLPSGAGETPSPRLVGSFAGDCLVVPVSGEGGMPKLQEMCLNGTVLTATTSLDSLESQGVSAGVYSITNQDYSIYVGSKSFFGDPLVGGRGVVLKKR